MAKLNLQERAGRARLKPRGKPYATRLIPGVWIAYRAAQSGTGAWVVIAADGAGGRWQKVIGHADDKQPADGTAVLSYEQAALKARALARGDANAAADRPASIDEAVTAYEANLTARGRNAYNARNVRFHLPAHLLAQPLSQVTAKQLQHWRDGLITAGMLPATLNRTLKNAHAAFNLAAKLDKRVRANAGEWKVGLEALPDAVTARDALLSDKQVTATVRAAYDISREFGLYVQVHAEVGARPSQLARCIVGDFEDGKKPRLLVPPSKKGRGNRKPERTPIPVTASLAARLRAACAGRPANAPLLLRTDGAPWQPEISDHRLMFERAARAAKLPADSTLYSLRHSSIARALLRRIPVRVVAVWHDSSTGQIERHYSRFIADHYDDLVRDALLDTAPTTPADVVPLRRA